MGDVPLPAPSSCVASLRPLPPRVREQGRPVRDVDVLALPAAYVVRAAAGRCSGGSNVLYC